VIEIVDDTVPGQENEEDHVHVKEDVVDPVMTEKEDPAEGSHLYIGMFLHQALNTSHHFNIKQCKLLDKSPLI
jgi:hypothetical protein